tara:strand:+ start:9199 stop:9939 length:741 start_codon:yes stop_codon:yes gene_type:complete
MTEPMTDDFANLVNSNPGAASAFLGAGAAEEAPDPLAAVFYEALFDLPVVTHTETIKPDYTQPHGSTEGPAYAEDVTVTDVTGRDVFQSYMDAPEAVRQALHERLYTAGFYPRTHPPDQIDHPQSAVNALERATSWYAQEGKTPMEALPAADKSLFVEEPDPGPRRATEAQIGAMADQMARSLLGRRATEPERRAAVAIGRRFEDQKQGYDARDFEGPLRFVAGDEVKARDMEKTLSVFERIVKGR